MVSGLQLNSKLLNKQISVCKAASFEWYGQYITQTSDWGPGKKKRLHGHGPQWGDSAGCILPTVCSLRLTLTPNAKSIRPIFLYSANFSTT